MKKRSLNKKLEVWITVTDENGKVESHRPANSLVMYFIDLLYVQMGQATISLTDIGGTPRSVNQHSLTYATNSAANTSTYGIRVGTGTTTVAVTDTALATPISHGAGAGNLTHGATSLTAPVTSGTSRQITISRTFTNNSGSDITVNEIGLVSIGTNNAFWFLVDRTLSTFTVTNATSKTVTYTLKVTV